MLRAFRNAAVKLNNHVSTTSRTFLNPKMGKGVGEGVQLTQTANMNYRSNELWKSVLSVSNQGSKKGRAKRRGAGRVKDLNLGQNLGDGKMQVVWPGLNQDVMDRKREQKIQVLGEDVDREKKLTELRNKMDKFKKITIPPHERGFTGSGLNGKTIGAPLSYDDVNFDDFDTRIIMYKSMLMHKSILGKKKTVSCFAITGNHNGIVGYGTGKGPMAGGAIKLAKAHASQRLLHIERYEERTLFHNFYEEYYHTKVYAEKKPKGYGLVCHRIVRKLCELIGIKDIYVKVEGSRNAQNITKAFLSGLLSQRKYADIAADKNLFVVEFKPETNYFPTVLGSPPPTSLADMEKSVMGNTNIKSSSSSSNDEDDLRDLNLYLFDNRFRGEQKKKLPFYNDYPSYKQYLKLKDKHTKLKQARIERIKLIPDEDLQLTRYPTPRVVKSNSEEEEEAEY